MLKLEEVFEETLNNSSFGKCCSHFMESESLETNEIRINHCHCCPFPHAFKFPSPSQRQIKNDSTARKKNERSQQNKQQFKSSRNMRKHLGQENQLIF